MSVKIAGKVVSAVTKGSKEVLRKSFKAPDRKVLYEQLYYSAQMGNLPKTAEKLKAQYPDMIDIIHTFVFGENSAGSSLFKMNQARQIFESSRLAQEAGKPAITVLA